MLKKQLPPIFVLASHQTFQRTLTILLPSEAVFLLPLSLLLEFQVQEQATIGNHTFISAKKSKKYILESNTNVQFSQGVKKLPYYIGLASGLLATAFSFNVRTINPEPILRISLPDQTQRLNDILGLTNARVQSIILSNQRGDIFGTPIYFVQKSKEIAAELGLGIKVLIGSEIKDQGLNMFHAVGRASVNEPALINLSYRGNPNSDTWLAFIGKGVCFDAGGIDIKSSEYIKPMFLDKCGACSCLAALEQIARQKICINVTVTLGMVENVISNRSYRPSDILVSKKGLTVEIADTDAEGRLVLADCMTWTQMNYKVSKMIELSTLTYSIIVALGSHQAGIFGNSESFSNKFKEVGQVVLDRGWIMPLQEEHNQYIMSKSADLLSDANHTTPGASIAAAFLQYFVEEGVEWIHYDIGGPAINIEENRGTGYGARSLLQIARVLADDKTS